MTAAEEKMQAEELAKVSTPSAITEQLTGWLSVFETHPQYEIKEQQIRIYSMALGERDE